MRPGLETASRWPAPAKLNLFLRILGRRPDGRHDLQTFFQLLDFGDEVEVAPRRDGRIVLRDPPPGLDVGGELSVRAARLLRERTGASAGASIRLAKRIPMGAGLGGGSSDAAAALVALNRLWGTGLDEPALASLGLALGADVPVFVHGRSGWAEGVGERIRPLPLPPLWYLVVNPGIHVSTAAVFDDPGLTRHSPPLRMSRFLAGGRADAAALLAAAGNDCEPVVRGRHPAVGEVIEWLRRRAEWARMTGTGGACFGVFRSEGEARAAARGLPAAWDGWVAHGIDESPLRGAGMRPSAPGS